MEAENRLIRIYAGTKIFVISLKNKPGEKGISATIQNDSINSFLRGVPFAHELHIQQSDFKYTSH
jgi:hypothetical protein